MARHGTRRIATAERTNLAPAVCLSLSERRRKPPDGGVRHAIGSRHVCLCFASLKPGDGLTALVRCQLHRSAKLDATLLRPFAAVAGADFDQLPLKLCKTAQHREHQPSVHRGGVSPCVGQRFKARPRPRMVCSVLSRSRVERASRSSRVTISTSPLPSAAMALASCVRSDFAPLAFSANSLVQPASRSADSCAASDWPSVLTRQYPIVAMIPTRL